MRLTMRRDRSPNCAKRMTNRFPVRADPQRCDSQRRGRSVPSPVVGCSLELQFHVRPGTGLYPRGVIAHSAFAPPPSCAGVLPTIMPLVRSDVPPGPSSARDRQRRDTSDAARLVGRGEPHSARCRILCEARRYAQIIANRGAGLFSCPTG